MIPAGVCVGHVQGYPHLHALCQGLHAGLPTVHCVLIGMVQLMWAMVSGIGHST
jgi:hypothetical protein